MAITAVFLSWDSPRATVYRERGGIPHDLGTAVTVQAMVFGTAPGFSGTGVAFTRDPSTGEPIPTGDWLANAQGEDVVDGSHATQPLAALADDAPAVWAELLTTLGTLEKHYRDLCDVEFTVEAGKLWILQTRVGKRSARASVRIAVDRATDPSMTFGRGDAIQAVGEHEMREVLESESLTPELQPLTRGIPASPGIATGRVRLSSDAAVDAAARGEKVILVRRETSPSDIHGMDAAEGILTATGGIVSHAAIVAREWGKVAVVGAGELSLGEDAFFIGTEMVREGEDLTIDGSTGHVFRGALERTQDQHDRHLVALLEWSKELAGDRGEPLATFKAARTLLMTEKT
jgi:pyruvate,orthophosphate dikinase